MNLSSTKNLLITSLLSFGSLALSPSAVAEVFGYQLQYDVRFGVHTYGASIPATHRHSVQIEQKGEFNSQWSFVMGGRAEVEAVYASVPERYSAGDVAKKDSQNFFLRDNYIQFQSGIFRVRAGYQQVVWGEAFGYYYADIVNPKDYREAALGDLSRNRIDVPILNLQWILSNSSVQLLYVPFPGYSLLPSLGSDFSAGVFPIPPVSIELQREPAERLTRGEYGLRITKQISSLDLSAYAMTHYDRMPFYQIQITPPFGPVTARPIFKMIETRGITGTIDLDGYLVRSEILQNVDREINTGSGLTVGSARSDEFVYVVGLDLPSLNKWQIGLQFSESRLSSRDWLGRGSLQSIASVRFAHTFGAGLAFESTLTEFTHDASSLIQVQLSVPISNQSEVLVGVDRFDGSDASELGRLKTASRIWVMLKALIKK